MYLYVYFCVCKPEIYCRISVAVTRNICRISAVQNVCRTQEFQHGFQSKPIPEMYTPLEITAVPEHFVL